MMNDDDDDDADEDEEEGDGGGGGGGKDDCDVEIIKKNVFTVPLLKTHAKEVCFWGFGVFKITCKGFLSLSCSLSSVFLHSSLFTFFCFSFFFSTFLNNFSF